MAMAGFMSVFHRPVGGGGMEGASNDNNAMLVRFSKQNLMEWKAEKDSWANVGKKSTRKDKIAARNRLIYQNQKRKKQEKDNTEDIRVDWHDLT